MSRPPRRRHPVLSGLGLAATLAAALYLLVALATYLFQERMLFLPQVPGGVGQASPADAGLAYESVWLRTEDGERLHAWWVPSGTPGRTVLFFHGNAGDISHRLESLRLLNALGLDVLILDYRGYGRSSGRPSEAGLYRDAEAAWGHLTGERGIDPGRILLFGRSMGGAVAAWLAARVEAAGLILESTFTSVPDLAAQLYWWLPARRLSRIELDTLGHLRRVDFPVLVVHSRDDEIIPFGHAERLAAAAPRSRGLLVLRGDHNGGFLASGSDYAQGLKDFIEGLDD